MSTVLGFIALSHVDGLPLEDHYHNVLLFKTAEAAREALGPLGGTVRVVVRAKAPRRKLTKK